MHRKKPHPLKLAKETLHSLTSTSLATAAGGRLSGPGCASGYTKWPETNCCDSYVLMC